MNPGLPQIPDRIFIDLIDDLYNFAHHSPAERVATGLCIGSITAQHSWVFDVGHCSFVKSPDNTEDWIGYHSNMNSTPGWERDVRMQPFTWNVDGTPNFGTAFPAGKAMNLLSGEKK